ncbi:hypothetical protein Tco_1277825, partial [Tanacetum coccineum]
ASPSPDYVLGPKYPPSLDFVLDPIYLEFMPSEDEVLPAEKHPLSATASPTADSPGYVPESDPEEDPKEDDDEDPEEDPADRGDDGDDEDESSNDDEDDDVDIEEDEEEEEHPSPADSTVVALPAADQAPSAEETEPFETDDSVATPPPHLAYRVARLLAIPTSPPSPLSLWSSPLPQIPSLPLPPILSPLPVSPPLPVSSPPPASPIRPLGYRAVMIRLRVEAPSTSYSLPLPPPIILSHTRSDAPSSGTPPLLPISLDIALGLRYEVGESSSALTARPPGGFRDEMLVDMPGTPATDDIELGRRLTEFTTRVRQDTYEIYTRLDDEQIERQLMAGWLNMLYRDRGAHARTARLIEAEARISREAWG